jgi:hypothetical protein
VTRWDEIKAAKARERAELTDQQRVDREMDDGRKDKQFRARVREIIEQDKEVLDRLRDR